MVIFSLNIMMDAKGTLRLKKENERRKPILSFTQNDRMIKPRVQRRNARHSIIINKNLINFPFKNITLAP